MNKSDIKQIGDEMVRVLEPVYQDLDSLKKDMNEVKKTLKEHTGKIDALHVEMHDLHQDLGGFKDKTNSEIDKIRDYVGLSSNNS